MPYTSHISKRIGTTLSLVILFVLLLCGAQWVSYRSSLELLRQTVYRSEIDKVNMIGHMVTTSFKRELDHLQQKTRLLALSRHFPKDQLTPAMRAEITASLARDEITASLDIVELVDRQGVVTYSYTNPDKIGSATPIWGVFEALEGVPQRTSHTDSGSVVLYSIEPVRDAGRITGAVLAGVRINEHFITLMSEDVNAALAMLTRNGDMKISTTTTGVAIDTQAVNEAFFQKIPIYRHNDVSHLTNVYLPLFLVDDGFVILIQLDSSPAYAMLMQTARKSALATLIILLASVACVTLSLRFILRPLRRLYATAGQALTEFTGQTPPRSHRDEVSTIAEVLETLTKWLIDKNRELTDANVRLKELGTMKSNFVSSVSHELRTPLTSVLGFAKIINRDFEKILLEALKTDLTKPQTQRIDRIRQNLQIIYSESERLTNMIGDILDLAKIETNSFAWNEQVLDIEELARNAVEALTGLFEQNPDVQLEMDIAPNLPPVFADPQRLHQVLLNLLSNALKFTLRGYVRLTIALQEDGILFQVSDSGVGISQRDQKRIFESFYQAMDNPDLTSKPNGTGLGLSISSNILAHYGSRISVSSEPGQGSVFSFVLRTHVPVMPAKD